jgi:predicted GTPase
MILSIVGPQSSGKSLLLNTLFGAQFLSSAGRCTRGVYGCLLDIKGSDKFKKILILDTEGIQSTEATDPSFDKRVVFYILSISHMVLICNKGEMN